MATSSGAPRAGGYVHGTSAEEQARLGIMNQILNEAELALLQPQPGERWLEFGAGTGILARDLARATGITVVGVEQSAEQLATAHQLADQAGETELTDLRQGDVLHPPLEPQELGSFDAVHARFLLEHLTDPDAAVRAMASALKPGGRMFLCDDDHEALRLWPEPRGWAQLWKTYWSSYETRGTDPLIGRKLVQLLARAGLTPVRTELVFYGACSGQPLFEEIVWNLVEVVEGARAPLEAAGLDWTAAAEVLSAVRKWGEAPDATVWYALPWVEGVRAGHPIEGEAKQ